MAGDETEVALDGTLSFDPNPEDVITYQWTQVGGPVVYDLVGADSDRQVSLRRCQRPTGSCSLSQIKWGTSRCLRLWLSTWSIPHLLRPSPSRACRWMLQFPCFFVVNIEPTDCGGSYSTAQDRLKGSPRIDCAMRCWRKWRDGWMAGHSKWANIKHKKGVQTPSGQSFGQRR